MGEILGYDERDPFDLENSVELGSPHVPGHLVSTPYASSCSQQGQPYHMAARADLRLGMRLTQSALITPEKGRDQDTIQLAEITHSLDVPRGVWESGRHIPFTCLHALKMRILMKMLRYLRRLDIHL